MATRKRGPVEQAIWRELDAKQRRSGLAMAIFEAARQLDDGVVVVEVWGVLKAVRMSARDTAVLVRELRATLVELHRVAPAVPSKDRVDDLNARRAARRAG